jgi:hypothetical protein
LAETLEQFAERMRAEGAGQMFDRLHRHLIKVSLEAEAGAKVNVVHRFRSMGGLVNSIEGRVALRGDSLAVALKAKKPYAGVQERGGTIRPKRGKWLAQPVGPALTRAGRNRRTSPRQFPGLFFRLSKQAGKALLMMPTKGGKAQVYFVLHRSVKLKGRHYLEDALKGAALDLPHDLQSLYQVLESP